jgi:limonene-1,2-epoxide hydrolase
MTKFARNQFNLTMNKQDILEVFMAIDSFDSDKFVSCMTEDAAFRFGNMPAVEGKDNIRNFVAGFFQSIKAIKHDQLEIWEADGVKLMNGRVTYTRHDDSILSVFFANTFKMKGDKVKDYFIFVDTSELYKQ